MRRIRFMPVALLTVGACLLTAGCTGREHPGRAVQVPAGFEEITSLYELATAPHTQATRKPVHDQRQRAMRLLAEKAEAMAADAATWDTDIRAIGLTGEEQVRAEADVQRFRSALEGLHAAAEGRDPAALRREYASAMAAYEHLAAKIPPPDERPE